MNNQHTDRLFIDKLFIDKLFIDKLAFTQAVPFNHRPYVANRIKEYVSNNPTVLKRTRGIPRYEFNYRTTIETIDYSTGEVIDATVLISLKPKDTGHKYIRVEFNPARFNTESMVALNNLLISIFGIRVAKRIFFKCKVTRLDIAYDSDKFNVNEVLIYVSNLLNTRQYCGKDGKIETASVGSKYSKFKVTHYDKGKEDKSGNYDGLTRLEISIKPRVSLHELIDLKCPYKRIKIFCTDIEHAKFSPFFLDSCRQRGVNSALKLLKPNERRNYSRWLKKHDISEQFHSVLWEQWPQALEILEPLKNKKYGQKYYSSNGS